MTTTEAYTIFTLQEILLYMTGQKRHRSSKKCHKSSSMTVYFNVVYYASPINPSDNLMKTSQTTIIHDVP